MTQHADTIAPRLPLVCDVVCGEALEEHVEAFRTWVGLLWELTVEALFSSGTIERLDDVYDKALWDGLIAIGVAPHFKGKMRRLSAKAWFEMLGADDLRGFGVSARPLPHVPEPPGAESRFSFDSDWQGHHVIPNSTSWLLPARYTAGIDDGWESRLVAGFATFGVATRVRAAVIGWLQTMRFASYPMAKTDYRTVLWLPGWAVLLSEGHMTKLGGASALDGSGLFHPVEQVGDGTYLVRSRAGLLDFDAAHLQEVESVLQPILLPPPYQGLEQS